MNSEKTSVVVTSIAAPNDVMTAIALGCIEREHDFIVIGDVPSPTDFQLEGCRFFGLQKQAELDFRSAALVPKRHYARKNIGYLLAIQAGAGVVVETDDDNFPLSSFWGKRALSHMVPTVARRGWLNAYSYFSEVNIWPRGLPLDEVRSVVPDYASLPEVAVSCPIQQGLANENPDVDAIYRLALPLPVDFRADRRIALGAGVWCPFNSQNTTWFREAFPLLYLPAFCSFRMTDIWRSFVAQRIGWECGWSLLFHEPTVYQKRNDHNLMRDFEDEIPGYLQNRKIADILEKAPLRSGSEYLATNLYTCYEQLTINGIFKADELPLVEGWISDLSALATQLNGGLSVAASSA